MYRCYLSTCYNNCLHIQAKLTVVNQKANNKEKEFIETIFQFVFLRTVLFGNIFFLTENHVKFIMNK
jgi:hypothetical protein